MLIQYEPSLFRSAAYDGAQEIGECCYSVSGNIWTIYHTEVDPAYGGQGIARKLVLAVKEAADEAGADVTSTCSYAYKVLGR
ncbi:MAG: N-acetyltransferase [Oscillospiraceae bacterium]|nr:N-acetyltransferase [Oscillospiraceae bacterium]